MACVTKGERGALVHSVTYTLGCSKTVCTDHNYMCKYNVLWFNFRWPGSCQESEQSDEISKHEAEKKSWQSINIHQDVDTLEASARTHISFLLWCDRCQTCHLPPHSRGHGDEEEGHRCNGPVWEEFLGRGFTPCRDKRFSQVVPANLIHHQYMSLLEDLPLNNRLDAGQQALININELIKHW